MKITPSVMSGAQDLANIQTGPSAGPDRIERAKALARGETLNIRESETPVDPQVRRMEESRRRIKMRVNQSPDRMPETTAPEPVAPVATEESIISPTNKEAAQQELLPISTQAAAFAKERRALQQARAAFEREKAQQKTSSMDGGNDLTARLKSEPLRVLQEQNLLTPEFYNALTDFLVSGKNTYNPEMEALKQEIKALKDGVDKRFVDTQTEAEESALTEMLYEAEELAKDGETYDLIRRKDAYDRVLRLIHTTYKNTGRVMDVAQAMNKVESDLEKEGEAYFQSPKIKSKFAPTPQQSQAPLAQSQQTGMKTLTNRDVAQNAPMDRRSRAMLAALGQLKRG